jgi:hypothetical protein
MDALNLSIIVNSDAEEKGPKTCRPRSIPLTRLRQAAWELENLDGWRRLKTRDSTRRMPLVTGPALGRSR